MTEHLRTLRCTVLTGRAGSGKTSFMLEEIIRQPGRYILAAPRRNLLEEHATHLRELGMQRSTPLVVATIHSDQQARESIGRRITDTIKATAFDDHVVIGVTHQALIALDPEILYAWHVRIDELPESGIVSGSVSLGATWPALERQYTLSSSDRPGWSVAQPRKDLAPLPLSTVTADAAQDLIGLHRAIATPSRTVYVDATDWADASLPRRPLRWWSIWSPADLIGCASLTMAGASYTGSLVAHAVCQAGTLEVDVREVDATNPRIGNPQVRLHYYCEHSGSTIYWKTDEGRRCLVKISKHLEAIAFDGFWTCNESIMPYFVERFPGEWYPPKQAGSNALRHHTACAIIYSSKAQAADEPLLSSFGIDRSDVQAAREDEDNYQFIMRGAIRNGDYDGRYDVYIYDRAQAERLQARLIEQRFADVALVAVQEAGIMDVVRPTQVNGAITPKTDPASIDAHRQRRRLAECERGRRRREAERAKRRAAGTLRPPGRPKRDRQS
ncbi:hypothetical protein MKK70_13415 [Methylobacterium sp. E-041]|uniref:hypothetical protein n=1 Tax=Methylobacterium sp. E-041 TaxID=2836573 RepID=UPI001FB90FB9|nr:hypothetical protein [Methylobacterium sp. E-041]MCJ2106363.1 hypothetical protein [Methylobacterium sp. E-041]